MDIFSNPIPKRIRKCASKKFHGKDTIPNTKKRITRVVKGILNKNRRMEGTIEDLEPNNLQEGYDICKEVAKTQNSK